MSVRVQEPSARRVPRITGRLVDRMRAWRSGRRLRGSRVSGVLLILALAGLWEAAVELGMIDTVSLPAFHEVIATWVTSVTTGDVFTAFAPSVERLAFGFALAVAAGVALGLAMGFWRSVFGLLEPLVESLRPIPNAAFIPVAILFLGIDNQMKVTMIALGAFFPILINTYAGVRSVDPTQIQTGRTFGVSGRRLLGQIVFPASLPYIFAGLRIGLATALIVTVVTEMLVSNDGIGFYIINAQRTFNVDTAYAGIISLGILGYALNAALALVERHVLRWHYEATA